MEDTKIQWHPGFVAAMNLEFKENRDDLIFEKEYNLNTKPLETDLLIIKKNPAARLVNEIGKFFRGHNIMEYKSPEDELNINIFYKVQGYACIYKAAGTASAGINEDDITTTIIREGKPVGLFKHLSGKGFEVTCSCKGIYRIHTGSLFPLQIIATKELEGDEHVWLRSLSEKLQKEDVKQLLKRISGLTGDFDKEMADSVLKISIDANRQLIKEMMEDESMYESLMELMEPRLAIRDKTKMEEGMRQGMQQGQKITATRMLQSGRYTLDEIADISGLSLKEIKILEEI